MHTHLLRRRPGLAEGLTLSAFGAVAFVLGGTYAVGAEAMSLTAVPGVLVLGIAIVATYRRAEIGIAFGLLLVPAGTLGFHSDVVSLSTLLLAWSVYIAVVAYRQRRAAHDHWQTPAIGIILVLYLCTAVLSVSQASNLHAAAHVVARLLTATLFFAGTVLAVRDRRSVIWVLGAMAAAGFLVGAHAVLDYASGVSGAGFFSTSDQLISRATAGFGQPNQLGGFLVVIVPLAAAGALMVRRGRVAFGTAALVASFGVYASFSRGALIGLAVVPFVFLRGWKVWVLGPLLVLVVVVSAPSAVRERFGTLGSSGAEIGTRTDIWRAAVSIWEQHPLLGVGVGGFPVAYAESPIPGKLYLPNTVFQPPPHAHNLFLNLLAEQGIVGFLVFAALIVVALRTAIRLRAGPERFMRLLGTGLLAALLAFLVHNLFDVTMFDSVTGPYVFVLFGLFAAAGQMAADRTEAAR